MERKEQGNLGEAGKDQQGRNADRQPETARKSELTIKEQDLPRTPNRVPGKDSTPREDDRS